MFDNSAVSHLKTKYSSESPFAVRCRHCGSNVESSRHNEFCCDGCQAVFSLLQAKDLSEFYEIKGEQNLRPVSSLPSNPDFSALDLPESISAISTDGSRIDFYVDDLSCSACVWILERLETVSSDILWSRVNLSRSTLTVAKSPNAKFSEIAALIRSLGFKAEPLAAESPFETLQRRSVRKGLIRTGVLAALSGNIMLLSISLYGGADGRLASIFQWAMAALCLPIVTWGAWPLYLNSWRSLRTKRLSLDVPIALAVVSGFCAGLVGLITNSDLLFFDSVAMLVSLLIASRTALEFLKIRFSSVDTVPQWLLQSVGDPDSGKTIQPSLIKTGQKFFLQSGQRLPVDAITSSSGILWDVSVITGESRPHESEVGEVLSAGSILLSDRALLQAKCTINDSRISKLLHEWRDGQRDRRGLSALSDRVGQYFTYTVLTLSIGLVIFELLFGFSTGPNGWVRALALLLAACPCVFGIGIPLAENLVMHALSRDGLIVREPSFLQKLSAIRHAYFDKTGTLTTGRLKLEKIEVLVDKELDENLLLQWAEAIERNDPHPIAKAICTEAHRRKLKPLEARDLRPLFSDNSEEFGTDPTNPLIACPVPDRESGRLIGRKGWIQIGHSEQEFQIETLVSDQISVTRVRLSLVKRLPNSQAQVQTLGVFSMKDEVRSGAKELLSYLRTRMPVGILSGDRKANVELLSRELLLSPELALGGLKPEAKATEIAKSLSFSYMLGDGANDAEALKRSFASTALKGDLSVCLESADSVLVVDSLMPILRAFKLADRLKLTLLVTLLISASINVLAATLAIVGLLTPLIAAILMPTSGLLVTFVTWLMLKNPSDPKVKTAESQL